MSFQVSERDLQVQQMAHQFAETELKPHVREADEKGLFDRSRVDALGKAGLIGGLLSPQWGGGGWSRVQGALAMMELGAVDSSWRGFVTVQACLVGLLLETVASDEQKDLLLPKLISGEWIFSYALTEPEAGTDVGSLATVAVKEGDDYLISGTKHWITNGGVADWIIVFANAAPEEGKNGITAFAVPGQSEGLLREPMDGIELGHRGSNHAVLRFDGVRVPASAMVGKLGDGFRVAMGGLEDGRIGVAAGAVGIQMACLAASMDFARRRRQFGRRIGDFQLVQGDLADMAVNLESTRLLTLYAASLKDAEADSALAISMAKYAASEAAVKAADQAVLIHGARGYSSAYPVERYLRDAKGLQIYEGTAHIQKVIIARALLGKDPARQSS